MSKYEGHTPGPWSRGKDSPNGAINIGKHGIMVCHIPISTKQGANAKLIADAPMLAERVEELEGELATTERMSDICTERCDKLAEQNERLKGALKTMYILGGLGEDKFEALIAEIEGEG